MPNIEERTALHKHYLLLVVLSVFLCLPQTERGCFSMENVQYGQRAEEPIESSICTFFVEGKLYKYPSVNQFNFCN